ncbi:MAG: GNAT family N-acetyltransferase [Candidatus Melainabacteria bacterium]|nr:GNAT family N-acetyltransferase [Candidatus Melainabacteria bacterium]
MQLEEIIIKEVSENQFDQIWPIFHEVIQDADTYPYLPCTTKEEAKKLWFTKDAHVYIAYLDGKPVATRYIVPNKAGLGSHVANTGVMIDKEYRGKGLGKQMMEFAINKTRELGFKAIQVNLVVCTNTASIKICQKYGFEIIGTLPKAFYYKQKEYVDAYVMYKLL